MSNLDLQTQLFSNRELRAKVTTKSHSWFFATYFANYMTHASSDLHNSLFKISEDTEIDLAVIMAFRGSAKSTIMTMSYPIWAILGIQQKKFVLIASQTQYQARVHLTNIKRELESNELLKNDLGPFVEQREEWGSTSLFIPKFNARITAISTEQSVRGVRHGAYRPDLIIADDVEDSNSVKTKEGRNKTFDWYTSEIVPAGDTNTKRIVVGNLLHEDSLLMRLKERITNGDMDGIFLEYPLVRDGVSLWPAKFPDEQSIEALSRSVANRIAWEREYMLNLVPDDAQIITRNMLHYYDELPTLLRGERSQIVVGVDLAISESDKADCTAMLILDIRGTGEKMRMYIRPHPINERLSFTATVNTLKELNTANHSPKFYIEQTAYQAAAVQVLKADGLDVEGVTPKSDKRSRLSMISDKIERGVILFPKEGADTLITQLVGYGIEKHDDLMDALTMAVLEHMRTDSNLGTVRFVDARTIFGPDYRRRSSSSRSSRSYWSRRLDDFNEATSGSWG
jgi:predicted phage terminase large subunit-like protein